jgi:hypothetical protein
MNADFVHMPITFSSPHIQYISGSNLKLVLYIVGGVCRNFTSSHQQSTKILLLPIPYPLHLHIINSSALTAVGMAPHLVFLKTYLFNVVANNLRRMGWAGYVARVGDMKNAYKILGRKT